MYVLFCLSLVVLAIVSYGFFRTEEQIYSVILSYLFHGFMSYILVYAFYKVNIWYKDDRELERLQEEERSGIGLFATHISTTLLCTHTMLKLNIFSNNYVTFAITLVGCSLITLIVYLLFKKVYFFRYNMVASDNYHDINELRKTIYFRYFIRKIVLNMFYYLMILGFLYIFIGEITGN